MAKMFPSPAPSVLREDPRRGAELKLYERLESVLPDTTCVLHGVAWLARSRSGGAQDGEADFVVIDPKRGILVVEVKGGSIAYDGATATWTSRDRTGTAHHIKDPVAQACTSHHALEEKIRSLPAWQNRCVMFGHAVAFPDCASDRWSYGVALPREITIFSDDFEWLDRKVEGIFDYWTGERSQEEIPAGGLRSLLDLLAPSFELRQPLGPILREDDREIVRLTEQQFSVLDLLRRQRRVRVRGGAGTGKTVLALEKAKRLAHEGNRTLLTCFNRPLADFLRKSAGQVDNLTIDTFHQLCVVMAQRLELPIPDPDRRDTLSPEEAKRYFGEILPKAFERGLDAFPTERYDAIVVDEGQDFDEPWWVLLQLALRSPDDGIFYVFYDDNQKIYRESPKVPEDLMLVDLTQNLRNTCAIQEIAACFYPEGMVVPTGPRGQPVELVAASGRQAVCKAVGRIVHRLVHDEAVPVSDIAVLTGRSVKKSFLGGEEALGAVRLTQDHEDTTKLLLESVHRFKGLERPVVILVEIDGALKQDRPEVLYVGLTRARVHLVVVASESTLSFLRGLDPER